MSAVTSDDGDHSRPPSHRRGDLHRQLHSSRSPTLRYRTTPLRGIVARTKGGFYHDGRYPTLRAVVDHYDSCFKLGLSSWEKSDLVEFLHGR